MMHRSSRAASRSITVIPQNNPLRGDATHGSASATFLDMIASLGAEVPYDRNTEIFGEDEPAEYFYQVIRGAVRGYMLLSDGRRQIGAFYLPGDVFGLEAGNRHRLTAETISDSTILVVKRSAVIGLANRDISFAREMWTMMARELRHVQGLMLTLGRKTAQERVAGFVLEMAARYHNCETVDLPMSRQDIADYLGLTIETVSRTISQLEATAAIRVPNSRRIELRDRSALARLSG